MKKLFILALGTIIALPAMADVDMNCELCIKGANVKDVDCLIEYDDTTSPATAETQCTFFCNEGFNSNGDTVFILSADGETEITGACNHTTQSADATATKPCNNCNDYWNVWEKTGACADAGMINGTCAVTKCPETAKDGNTTYNTYMKKVNNKIYYTCVADYGQCGTGKKLNTWTDGDVAYTDGKCVNATSSNTTSNGTETASKLESDTEQNSENTSVVTTDNCVQYCHGDEITEQLTTQSVDGVDGWIVHKYKYANRTSDTYNGEWNDYRCTQAGKHLDVYKQDGYWYTTGKCVDTSALPGCTQAYKKDQNPCKSGINLDDWNPSVITNVQGDQNNQDQQSETKTPDTNTEIRNAVKKLDTLTAGFKVNKWRNADGEFNTARLASDLTAGVVLGTAGALITSNLVKKSQLESGFEDIQCTISGQTVAEFGDAFTVGVK